LLDWKTFAIEGGNERRDAQLSCHVRSRDDCGEFSLEICTV
jgi:hypothetical protein